MALVYWEVAISTRERSLQVWTIYLAVVGLWLLLFPASLFALLEIDDEADVWVRVIGMLALVLMVLYLFVIRSGLALMYQGTVYVRLFAAIGFTVLAFTAGIWQLTLFAALDAAGAMWTHVANRRAV